MVERQTELEKLIWPVMNNAKQVKDCVGMYEAIGQHALAINDTKFSNFFALVQNHALQLAVLGIAKIYDATNKRFKKHTIYALESYLKENLNTAALQFSGDDMAEFLALDTRELNALLWSKDGAERLKKYEEIFDQLVFQTPRQEEHSDLKSIITYRHKFVSHQEQLTEALSEMHRRLPRLEVFTQLAEYAEDYAMFVSASFSNIVLGRHTIPSAKMSTYNVLKKVLNLDFNLMTDEGRKARDEFYGRNL